MKFIFKKLNRLSTRTLLWQKLWIRIFIWMVLEPGLFLYSILFLQENSLGSLPYKGYQQHRNEIQPGCTCALALGLPAQPVHPGEVSSAFNSTIRVCSFACNSHKILPGQAANSEVFPQPASGFLNYGKCLHKGKFDPSLLLKCSNILLKM